MQNEATSVRTCPPGTVSHIIKAEDTFYRLAQEYNITVDTIIATNPGMNPENLHIGQIICIPVSVPPATCPPNTRPYMIMAGDTLYYLAIRYNTTVGAIQSANPNVDPTRLMIGQIICIPV